ncbi:MAG TPA: hypothetical protein VMB48_08875 [Steroidobacteraceae bacterium]|nr:hypothetical protein [Steroidobacteraceae bacterium]
MAQAVPNGSWKGWLRAGIAAALWVSGAWAPIRASAGCDQAAASAIPERATGAPTGSEFAHRVQDLSGPPRDALVNAELLSGNLPHFLRRLVPVTLRDGDSARTEVVVCVLPDYLAVGSDRDFVFVPMGLQAALTVADRFGFTLPTPKLVDAIYAAAVTRLAPIPLPAGDLMRSTAYIVRHNALISQERAQLGAVLGDLTAGDKKDLVLTNRLWEVPGHVAIYGWHLAEHHPIQPLSTLHGARYADYSHGVRLVSDTLYVNGRRMRMAEALGEPAVAHLLTSEGPLADLPRHLSALMAPPDR